MKKLLYITACLAVGLSGCKDEFDLTRNLEPSLTAHWLQPSKTSFDNMPAAASSETFHIESHDTPWRFSKPADWLTLTPISSSGSATVTLSVAENKSGEQGRTAVFYLQSDDPTWQYSRAMSVSQVNAAPTVILDQYAINLSGAASQQTVNVAANCTWSASSEASWITVSEDVAAGKIAISVTANPQSTYRTGSVSISYGQNQYTMIAVTQSPAEVTSSTYTLQYENVASRYDVEINSEADWNSVTSDSWITVKPDNGKAGKTTVAIEVAPNTSVASRKGYVTIRTGSAQRLQIEILQKGLYIEADQNLEFTSVVESKKLIIHSNTNWTVMSKPDWLSLSKTSGNGNGEITVTSTDNPNTTSRSGEIVIGQPGLSMQCVVMVTQAGKFLSTDVSLLEFGDKAAEQTFNLLSDASWKASQSANWFATTPIAGYGDATITVSAEANNSTDERNGTISYAYADKSTVVNVHQLAKYMTIDNRAFNFGSHGGSHTIDLATNDEWTAEIEQGSSWLKLSKTSGSGNASITLTAADNASIDRRSAAVVITTKYAQNVRILVTQEPRHLSVSTQSVLFFANGGTSEPITIDTDGAYELKSDASWFTVNKGADNTFTVTAAKNTTNDVRRAKIYISLTDLKEGSMTLELTVLQAGEGGSFIINGYPDDVDWNTIGSGPLSFTIKGYTADKNWNVPYGTTLSVKVNGFTEDKDWNKSPFHNKC